MKYYIIAGEASGDLHGSRLIRAIRKNDSNAIVRAWGGDLMKAEGAVLVKHYRDLAFMGFVEVLFNISTIFRNMRFCKKDILTFNPDVVICIDYPGFNLPIATFAKAQGYKTTYYISPQIWAWKEKRVHTIKKVVDLMMVILPFEKDFYKKWNVDVEYVGHPLIEIIEGFKQSNDPSSYKKEILENGSAKIVAILPGSRKQEIRKKLPIMLESTNAIPDCVFVVAQAPGIEKEFIEQYTRQYKNVLILNNQTYLLLSIADAAMVTSGTATLETALFRVPQVVCYKTSPLSYLLAKNIIKVKFISLVNLIMDKLVVKELIQDQLQPQNIARETNSLLHDDTRKEQLQNDYTLLHQRLKTGGDASNNAAQCIEKLLKAV